MWRTKFACKDREVSDSCVIRDSVSGEVLLDLTSLKGTYTINSQGLCYVLCKCLSGADFEVLQNGACRVWGSAIFSVYAL